MGVNGYFGGFRNNRLYGKNVPFGKQNTGWKRTYSK